MRTQKWHIGGVFDRQSSSDRRARPGFFSKARTVGGAVLGWVAVSAALLVFLAGCRGNSAKSDNSGRPFMPSAACGGGPAPWNFHPAPAADSASGAPAGAAPWVASDNLQIAVNSAGRPPQFLSYLGDMNPSWSKSGSMIAYFHGLYYGSTFDQWKTAICVIHSDGSQPTVLTSGQYADFDPTWTRDGTNRIIFNRYAVRGNTSNDIYIIAPPNVLSHMISPQGAVGTAVLVSSGYGYEHAYSGLKDGRIFIDRINWASGHPYSESFLMTPHPGSDPTYEEITRPIPHSQAWQQVSVSPDETRIAYMLDATDDFVAKNGNVLYYADFNVNTRVVSNPVAITTADPAHVSENPAWSADGSTILYDSNRSGIYQVYAYHLADHATTLLSDNPLMGFQSPVFENAPK
ncbi:MAG: TolB family protein [Terracidiphilus sp.]